MEEIIKKAIDGGYKNDTFFDDKVRDFDKLTLDPLFWQALNKACGWDKLPVFPSRPMSSHLAFKIIPPQENYRFITLRFHEINLTEGWEKAIEYLESLIK